MCEFVEKKREEKKVKNYASLDNRGKITSISLSGYLNSYEKLT